MSRRFFRQTAAVCLAISFAILLAPVAGCGKGAPQLQPPEPPTVSVIAPQLKPYAPYKDFTGRLASKEPVKVQPQVSGLLLRRLFVDGKIVRGPLEVLGLEIQPGEPLYEIDPVLYEADLKSAIANQEKAVADVKNWNAQIVLAEIEFKRIEKAVGSSVGAIADKDKAQANLDVAKAQKEVAVAQKDAMDAARMKAAENRKYCTIRAPTTGRVQQTQVADKSLVTAYQTVLTEVFPVDPIYAYFDVDELTSLWYRDQIFDKKTIPDPNNPATPLKCGIMLKDEKAFSRWSIIDYVAPLTERSTGTRMIRATFANPTGALSAGDSVRVRVDAGSPRPVVMVPETVVLSSSRSKFVYVVNGSDEIELRVVELGPSFDGWQVIESGLTVTDRVAATNLLRVRPGVKVKVQ